MVGKIQQKEWAKKLLFFPPPPLFPLSLRGRRALVDGTVGWSEKIGNGICFFFSLPPPPFPPSTIYLQVNVGVSDGETLVMGEEKGARLSSFFFPLPPPPSYFSRPSVRFPASGCMTAQAVRYDEIAAFGQLFSFPFYPLSPPSLSLPFQGAGRRQKC